MQHTQEKMVSVEEDRNWLEKQLKSAKKQNKLLRAELEIRLTKRMDYDASSVVSRAASPVSDGGGYVPGSPEDHFPSININTKGRSQSSMGMNRGREAAFSPLDTSSGRHTAPGFRPGSRGGTGAGVTSPLNKGKSKHEAALKAKDKEIRALRQSLAGERKSSRQARASMVALEGHRNDVEEFFIKCIDDVKHGMAKRRVRGGSTGKSMRSTGGASESEIRDIAENLGFEEFTATDRRKVMEYFLTQDHILAFLYDQLFTKGGDAGVAPSPMANPGYMSPNNGGMRSPSREFLAMSDA